MNKLWLKITGFVVLALAAIIVVNAFWPTGTAPTSESNDMKQVKKEDKSDLKPQQVVQQPEEKEAVEQAESIPNAEKLYQIALFYKEPGDSPDPNMSYEIVLDCCGLILNQYPNTPQAEKARELLQKVPEDYRKRYDEGMRSRYLSKPKVKKSRSLRRRS